MDAQHLDAPRLRVGGDVDGQQVSVGVVRGLAAAVPGAEPLRPMRLRQRADRREAVVLQQHEDHLDLLLDDGRQLHRQHLVGAVADDGDHLGVGPRELHAQRRRNLVAHAGEGVLDVVLLRRGGLPQALEVARHGAGGIDDNVRRAHQLVECAEHFRLGGQRRLVAVVALLGLTCPAGL